jgi:hypothetical protein
LWNRYATINWAVDYVAPLFALQAILLLVIGTIFNALTFYRRGIAGRIGFALAIFGIVAYPCLTALFRRSWSGMEIFGIAPDPTVIATLGFLLMSSGRLRSFLFPIPQLWLSLSALTLRTLREVQFWLPLVAALAANIVQMTTKRTAG